MLSKVLDHSIRHDLLLQDEKEEDGRGLGEKSIYRMRDYSKKLYEDEF